MSDLSINKQVENALNAIIEAGLASNKKGIAVELGYSPSYFSEILKGRMKVGSDFIQKLLTTYNIDPNYLFGVSSNIFHTPCSDSTRNSISTPYIEEGNTFIHDSKVTNTVSPKSDNIVSPTVSPTHTLGLPKVVTVTEDEKELISLVPVKAAAGYLNGYADPEYVEKLPTLRMPNMGNGTHRAFEIKGHSMNPTLYNGSISIGRWLESLDEIRDRRIYIIVTKTDGIVVKRVLNRINESGKLILISDNQNKREYPNIHLYAEDVLEIWYQRANLAFEFPEPDILYNRVNDLEAKMSLLMEHFQKSLK